ncbi:DUF3631 domain-containing protein [Rickettsiales bacterium]|nr:DUF3631 domain-containing protein [Rickettsiales bacterium]
MSNLNDSVAKLRQDMMDAGVTPPENIETKKYLRFNKKKASWLWVDSSFSFGAFGDFSLGISMSWSSKSQLRGLSKNERKALEKQKKTVMQKAWKEQESFYDTNSIRANKLWNRAKRHGLSSYLKKKKAENHGVRFLGDSVVIPVKDINGKLWSLQFIKPNGEKSFLKGGKKKSSFFIIGDIAGSDCLYIGEGYSTMSSVYQATGIPCIVAFDAGNLEPVIKELLEHYPKKKPFVLADDDAWKKVNTGKLKAEAACRHFKLPTPVFPYFHEDLNAQKPTDWNDLHVLVDMEEVKKQIEEGVANAAYHEPEEASEEKELPPYQHDPEPYFMNVEGDFLLSEISDTIRQYVGLSFAAADAIALYIVYTHRYKLFPISPKLAIISPQKRCGKTTLLSIISKLVRRPLSASNITQSAVYRVIDAFSPTIIIDEADTFLRNNVELNGIINSSHSIDMSYVIRSDGENFETKAFNTFAPIVIASIGKLKGTLLDRSVVIPMQRIKRTDKLEKFRSIYLTEEFLDIPGKIERFWEDNLEYFKESMSVTDKKLADLPESISSRAIDNWLSLCTVAEIADSGGDWPERAIRAMMELSSGDNTDDNSISIQLLSDVRLIVNDYPNDKIPTQELITKLKEIEEAPWLTYSNGNPITDRNIAGLLSPYGIKSKSIRTGDKTHKGYEFKSFNDVFERYLPSLSVTEKQPSISGTFQDPTSGTDTYTVTDKELAEAE